jgi:Multimeric flavodoxin WrbA
MKKILFITASPTVRGNGDALINAAKNIASQNAVEIKSIELRNLEIHPCNACYACKNTGKCVQKDDFMDILTLVHQADIIIVESPIYYNCLSAQAMIFINRFCCTFAYPEYKVGPKKKVGILLTCVGSKEKDLKQHVQGILTLPSLARGINGFKTEVFSGCITSDICKKSKVYLERVRQMVLWSFDEI